MLHTQSCLTFRNWCKNIDVVKADVESWNSLVNPEDLQNQKNPTDKNDTNYSGSLSNWKRLLYVANDMLQINISMNYLLKP